MFKKFVLALISLCSYFVSIFVEKNKNLILFGAWSGKAFSDNSKYLYLHALKNIDNKEIFWVTRNKCVYSKLKKEGCPVVYIYSLAGIYKMMTASVAYSTHGAKDFSGFLGSGCKLIYLSHGFPFKKIGFDSSSDHLLQTNCAVRIKSLSPLFRTPDICIASDLICQERFMSAFGLPKSRVLAIGFPRWEGLIGVGSNEEDTSSIYKVLYAPTVREFGHKVLDFISGEELSVVAAILKQGGVKMFVRPHPSLVMNYSEALERYPDVFQDFGAHVCSDISERLSDFDCLVFDYSSIGHDFSLLGKPIVCFAPDVDSYKHINPGLYDLEELPVITRINIDWMSTAQEIIENGCAKDKGTGRKKLTDADILIIDQEIMKLTLHDG